MDSNTNRDGEMIFTPDDPKKIVHYELGVRFSVMGGMSEEQARRVEEKFNDFLTSIYEIGCKKVETGFGFGDFDLPREETPRLTTPIRPQQ